MKVKSLLILLLLILVVGCSQYEPKVRQGGEAEDYPFEDVSVEELEALDLAINDEYKAREIYLKVLSNHGQIRPFSNIVNAELNHIDELSDIFNKYGRNIPSNNWAGNVPEFDSIKKACEGAVQAEIENADLYDELLKKVDNQDITAVFIALRDASRNSHLPAFEKCAAR